MLTCIIGCQKEASLPTGMEPLVLSIQEARSHFESKFNSGQLRKSGDGNNDERSLLWEKAYNKRTSKGEAVAVPIEMKDAKWDIGDGHNLPFRDVNYVLMYKNEKKEVETEWIEMVPDKEFLYGDQKKYTGTIFVKSWEGTVKKVFLFDSNGAIHERIVKPVGKDIDKRINNYSYTTCITVLDPPNPNAPTKITMPPLSSQTGNGGGGSGTYKTYCKTVTVYVEEDPWGGHNGTAGSGGVGSAMGHLGWYSSSGSSVSPIGGSDYIPSCNPNLPVNSSVPPGQLPACGTYTPAPNGTGFTINGTKSGEPNLPFVEGDPEELWWDAPLFDWKTQTLPTYAAFYAAYPKNPSNPSEDMVNYQVYALVGGNVNALYLDNPATYRNACALRVSRGLNYSGVEIPYIASHTVKGGDGKYYFLSVDKLYNWMKKVFPTNQLVLTNSDGGTGGILFKNKINPNKGIYIMRPRWPGKAVPAQNGRPARPGFEAQGHGALYNGTDCIGNCHFGPDGGVHTITVWKLN